MSRTITLLGFALSFAALTNGAIAQQPAKADKVIASAARDLSGNWRLTSMSRAPSNVLRPANVRMVFKQDGNQIEARMRLYTRCRKVSESDMPYAEFDVVFDGQVEGSKINLDFLEAHTLNGDRCDNREVREQTSFEGTLSADDRSISGQWTAPMKHGTWTLVRQ